MRRLRQAQAEAMGRALNMIPRRLHEAVGCDLFCADPIFAGIYRDKWANEDAADGRSYRRLAHVAWPYHSKDGTSTLVMPRSEDACAVIMVHELGHVLHWHLQQRAGGWDRVPRFERVSDYAGRNGLEEFAEAFTQWCCWTPEFIEQHPYWSVFGWSRPNAEWFNRLLAT